MAEEPTCKIICDSIVDENKAQPYYKNLANQLEKNGSPKEAEIIRQFIVKDEASHEKYMKILDKSYNCGCK